MDRIKVIGTSHISKDSITEIKKVMETFNPEIVAVELDEHRYLSLFSGKGKKIKISDIRKLGFFGFAFYLFGSVAQKMLGKRIGSKPGNDMKTGIVEAKKIGARVALIDQDISITLNNMSRKVSFIEKLKLFAYILFGALFMNRLGKEKFDLTTVPKDDLIKKLVLEMKHKFPDFYKILVSDRDVYMQNQIKILAEKFPKSKILVIVGAGHKTSLNKFVTKLE